MKLSYLVRGLPGHPIHPPLTAVTIGSYTFGIVAAFTDVVGWTNAVGAQAWWFALLVGAVSSSITVTTGLVDWLKITWGSELWKTATTHALVNACASVFFVLALITGHDDFLSGNVSALSFVLTLVGWLLLAVGGWIGGAITYVHGMRVLNLQEEPAGRAMAPAPTPEKERAEG